MTTILKDTPSTKVGDKWELVSLGAASTERRAGREITAKTSCVLSFCERAGFEKALDELLASDIRLASKRDGYYDWNSTEVLDDGDTGERRLIIRFDVVWYGDDGFAAHRSEHATKAHQQMFASFGLREEDVIIEHWARIEA
jgi:hypothetical protein